MLHCCTVDALEQGKLIIFKTALLQTAVLSEIFPFVKWYLVYICTKLLHICTAAQTVPNKFLALANFVKRLLMSILVTIHKLHLMM